MNEQLHRADSLRETAQMAREDAALMFRPFRWLWLWLWWARMSVYGWRPDEQAVYSAAFTDEWKQREAGQPVRVKVQR